MEWSDFCKLLKREDKLKTGYKYVANLAQRIAYNLGNTPSQTEIKIVSCIPIDVTDLHKKIFRLECELEQVIREKKHAEKVAEKAAAATSHLPVAGPVQACPEVAPVRRSRCKQKPCCNCSQVPISISCGDPLVREHRSQPESAPKSSRRPHYKSIDSVYMESGMGSHGDPQISMSEKSRIVHKRTTVVNCSAGGAVEPLQYCHYEPTSGYRRSDPQDLRLEGGEIISERYLQPITECCRMESTLAFHRKDSCTGIPGDKPTIGDLFSKHSSLFKHNGAAPEIRNVTTAYDWYTLDDTNQQMDTPIECGEPIQDNIDTVKNILTTNCINPQNLVSEESKHDSILISAESLGLPNTEPKRMETELLVNQATQKSLQNLTPDMRVVPKTESKRAGMPSKLCKNRATQEPFIESCSCCFFKQLTSEQLLKMPRSPLRKFLNGEQQTQTSSRTTAESVQLYERERVTQRRRNAVKIAKAGHGNVGRKYNDHICNSYLKSLLTKYQTKCTMHSTSSQCSAPICRDEASESCSCCAGMFYDLDLLNYRPQLHHFVNSSTSSNQQYYDDSLYDLVPVKEQTEKLNKDNQDINKVIHHTRTFAKNDVIVNYMVKSDNKNKVPIPKQRINKTVVNNISAKRYLQNTPKDIRKEDISRIYKANNKKNQVASKKKSKSTFQPKTHHIKCQTEPINNYQEKNMPQREKHDEAITQIKQTLQFVLDRFKKHRLEERSKKDAILQCCQCDLTNRIPCNNSLLVSPYQTNPGIVHHITPGSFLYSTMPMLTHPWMHERPIFVPRTVKPKHKVKHQSTCKARVKEKKSPVQEIHILVGDGDTPKQVLKAVISVGSQCYYSHKVNQSEQTTDQSTYKSKMEPNNGIHTIIISNTNISKKQKNKKINCCLSSRQNFKNYKKLDEINNDKIEVIDEQEARQNPNFTGSTVRQVIDELNKMEDYISRSVKMGDVASSKGSLDKPKKKFVDILRNFKDVFKSRNKSNNRTDKRMSCDSLCVHETVSFRIPSVHLVYPPKTKFQFPRRHHRPETKPLMTERYSFSELQNKKCRHRVFTKRNRRSARIKF